MTESDDDYDRDSSRRRGKFRKERDDSHGYHNNNNSANYANNNGMEINPSRRRDYDRPMRASSFKQNGNSHSHRRTPSPKRGFSPQRDRNSNNRYQNQQQSSYYSNRSPPRTHYSGSSGREHHRRDDQQPLTFKRHTSPYGGQFNPTFNGLQMQHRPRSPPLFGNQHSVDAYYAQDGPNKKLRREWSPPTNNMLDNNYFEHDNRLAPEGGYMNEFVPGRSANPRTYNPSYRYDLHPEQNFNPGLGLYNQQADIYGQQYPQNKNFMSNNFGSVYANNMMSNNGQFGQMGSNINFHQPQQQQQYMNNPNPGIYNSFNGQMFNGMNNRNFAGSNMNSNNLKFNNANTGFNNINNNLATNNYNNNNNNMNNSNFETQPQMLSFKQFLSNLNSSEAAGATISPEMATKRYNEYKNEFRSVQIGKFFADHKNEDWFKQRYHPEVSAKRKDEQRGAIKRRLVIFRDLMEKFNANGDELTLDMSQEGAEKRLFKFLDACMIKLEGGTDEDLRILERIYNKQVEKQSAVAELKQEEDVAADVVDKMIEEDEEESGVDSNSGESEADADQETDSKFDRKKNRKKTRKASKTKTEDKGEDIGQSENNQEKEAVADKVEKEASVEKADETLLIPQKTQSIFFKHLPVNVTRQDLEEIGSRHDGFKRASISEPAPERRFQRRGWLTFTSHVNIKEICSKINGVKCKDFTLNASINRELDQKVKCIIGLTNHKQILRNDLKLLARIVENMDRRWGLWQHENSYSNNCLNDEDFKTDSEMRKSKSAKKEETNEPTEIEKNSAPQSQAAEEIVSNPLTELANAYLKSLLDEQASTEPATSTVEEKEEDGKETEDRQKASNGPSSKGTGIALEKDERAATILDNLILYLRIVHSIDFYNATEYQQEDWMPNRCGVLHVRGSTKQKSSSNSNAFVNVLNGVNINFFDPDSIKKGQIEEWNRQFEASVKSYYEYKERIDDEIGKRLGAKDLKTELDKFIAANTQQVDKEVWLCVLSGKKFKSPEYVKKHIETKHREKLVEIRIEFEYFNRFVYDPKRPYLPEHPLTKMMGHHSNGAGGNSFGGGYGEMNNGFGHQGSFYMGGGGNGHQNGGFRQSNYGQRRY